MGLIPIAGEEANNITTIWACRDYQRTLEAWDSKLHYVSFMRH
jgi:hypothetical protein